jgi:malonate transporter
MLLFYVVFYLMQRRIYGQDVGPASVQTLTAALPNYASVGLPLLGAVYGASSALSVAVAIAVGATTVSPLTLFFLSSAAHTEGSAAARFFTALKHTVGAPIVWGPLLGLVLALANFQLPDIANRCFNLIGTATAGASLFLTGLILSSQRLRINGNVIVGVLIKNVLQPVVAYGIVRLFQIPDPIGSQCVMLAAIPAGFFGMVFGAAHNVKSEEAGSTLVLSSVLSMVTLAIAIMILAPK